MKVEDPSALEVQWFHHKTHVLPKGDESSWQNYTKYAARSATTKRTFIATEKIRMDTRSTSVRSVGISGRQIHHMSSQGVLLVLAGEQTTQPALSAEGQCMCITIEITTFTTPAQTRNAVTLYLRQSPRPFQRHPCPSSLERRTSSGCAIPSM